MPSLFAYTLKKTCVWSINLSSLASTAFKGPNTTHALTHTHTPTRTHTHTHSHSHALTYTYQNPFQVFSHSQATKCVLNWKLVGFPFVLKVNEKKNLLLLAKALIKMSSRVDTLILSFGLSSLHIIAVAYKEFMM